MGCRILLTNHASAFRCRGKISVFVLKFFNGETY